MRPSRALLCAALVAGCAGPPRVAVESPTRLTVGVLADSQLQTDQTRIPVLLLTGRLEDRLVDVSLRPPALNLLSADLLEYFVERLVSDPEVDVVLYLGDAANNGCEDEFRRVTAVLDQARRSSGKPVFMVIGNHDYLGAGNTTYLSDRAPLCDQPEEWGTPPALPNLPMTKFELMREVHYFNANREYRDSGRWRYEANFDEERLYADCLPDGVPGEHARDEQHSRAGCFLAATARASTAGSSVEIVLLDTSDYYDKGFRYTFALRREYFGVAGWISTKDDRSQARWLETHKQDPPPDVRIFASHFPPDSFGLLSRVVPTTGVLGRLGDVFFPEPPGGTLWVAGHTHKWLGIGSFAKTVRTKAGARRLELATFGVGSTTDSAERGKTIEPPHAALLRFKEDGSVDPERIEAGIDCRPTHDAVADLRRIRPYDPTYQPVRGEGGGRTLLGLDKSYRRRDWTVSDEINSIRNLETFVAELELKKRIPRTTARPCLALLSSGLEQSERAPFSLPRPFRRGVEVLY